MAGSKVEVFNLALALLGGHQLLSFEAPWEDDNLGRLCDACFPQILREALEAHEWSFAQNSQDLARLDEPGRDGYDYRFKLPADCIRPVRVVDGSVDGPDYIIEGGHLLTTAPSARLLYVVDLDDPKRWPPSFTTALAWGVAAVLAMANNNDTDKQQVCIQNFKNFIEQAWARDLQQQNPAKITSAWSSARHGVFYSGDHR